MHFPYFYYSLVLVVLVSGIYFFSSFEFLASHSQSFVYTGSAHCALVASWDKIVASWDKIVASWDKIVAPYLSGAVYLQQNAQAMRDFSDSHSVNPEQIDRSTFQELFYDESRHSEFSCYYKDKNAIYWYSDQLVFLFSGFDYSTIRVLSQDFWDEKSKKYSLSTFLWWCFIDKEYLYFLQSIYDTHQPITLKQLPRYKKETQEIIHMLLTF